MAAPEPDFESLLQFLKQARGFDFTGYKRTTLMRLMRKRMATVSVESFPDYQDYLEVHPDEFLALFDALLVNVTGFFRDPAVWELVRREVLPSLVAHKQGDASPIRVWSVGCASGEEPYTLAMVLVEALGAEAFRQRVKIFATDVDEDALTRARAGIYSEKDLEAMDRQLRSRYFEPVRGAFQFRTDLRRAVIFGRNDLVQDAPISHVDLIACRNTLMYFTAEAQNRITDRLHFALEDSGYLILGRAETMFTRSLLFRPLDLKLRVFTKVPRPARDRRRVAVLGAGNGHGNGAADADPLGLSLRDATFMGAPTAQLVVNAERVLVMVNARACAAFGIDHRDVGRPLADLPVSFRPVDLEPLIQQACTQTRTIYAANVEHARDGQTAYYDVQATPMLDAGGVVLGASVTFLDITSPTRLQHELIRANRELETAYEELQSTNEELQSTIEELETTNEELQSSNEELETINEEMQSTNEELQTLNDELNQRTEEVDRSHALVHSVLSSLRAAVIVLDQRLEVTMWNGLAESLWGLRSDEVRGESILGLDFGLPLDELRGPMKACLNGGKTPVELEIQALNRRGRAIRCRARCAPLRGNEAVEGVILTVEEIDG